MLILLTCFAFLTCCWANDPEEDRPIITLPNGIIRGELKKTIGENKTYYSYMSIPFAKPPVGELRFAPPQPADNWDDILEAKVNKKICYQVSTKVHARQYEDCLYINVFTPIAPGGSSNAPVKIGIYGGSFTHGYASFTSEESSFTLESGIIVVSFNYRVGPFGFLSTGDEVVPGNMGLKDQLLALKWVQENIHLFGGDPNKVIISGQSAGAASVTYQILSPQAKGLFRGAIASSGSALCDWANMGTSGPDKAYGVAGLIDPTLTWSNSTKELVDFLRNASAESIHDTSTKYYVWAPVIEVEHPEAFITESMYESVKEGRINRVPLLIGFNSEEEVSKMGNIYALRTRGLMYDHNVKKLVDGDMNIADQETLKTVGTKIKEMYTSTDLYDDMGATVRFLSDSTFVRGVLRYAELQSKYTDVYAYEFGYHGLLGNNNLTCEGCGRVQHGEEGRYSSARADLEYFPASDIKTVERFVGIMNNFVKTLNPTPTTEDLFQNLIWPKVTPDEFQYMRIDTDLSVRTNPRKETYRKWVDLYNEYAVEPLISF
ncbi:hypothetical protein JTB14_032584 [Gonioctena quinquepunctata]|nr:hypothetical protein JTB14_032584 [Gonioctena quinquepunctata]